MVGLSWQTLEASSDLFGPSKTFYRSFIIALNHIKKTFVRSSGAYASFFGHTRGVYTPTLSFIISTPTTF